MVDPMKIPENIYGHPMNYPITKHVSPPKEKPKKRVVEPVTKGNIIDLEV
jgi:hypothetical protein